MNCEAARDDDGGDAEPRLTAMMQRRGCTTATAGRQRPDCERCICSVRIDEFDPRRGGRRAPAQRGRSQAGGGLLHLGKAPGSQRDDGSTQRISATTAISDLRFAGIACNFSPSKAKITTVGTAAQAHHIIKSQNLQKWSSEATKYEGAVAEDGRSPSIWDTFTHAGKMVDKSTGDVAADGYHRYKDDIKLMADTNLEAYRFSISWSRLIPNGRGAVNPKGLEYYNNLIDELMKRGIQVHVMLYQLDFPQVLDDDYGGWLSPRIVEDFTAFADVCFREFGDRVSYWTTIDEPNVGAIGSYDTGQIAPGHCSDPFGTTKCTVGDSTVEPYVAAHNMILAHASATRLYKGKYQAMQKGVIGINIYSFWAYPLTNSTMDLEATKRCLDFMFAWILEPLVFGDYPQVMKKIVGPRLPSFTKVQSEAVKGAIDFIGINHYYSLYVNDRPLDKGVRDYALDMSTDYRGSKTDPPVGKYAPTSIPTDPEGLQLVLQYLKEVYEDLPLYVQETGYASSNDTVHDTDRVEYLESYIGSTLTALRNGVNVKGYFTWAFMDVFEFLTGYQSRYGLYHVDFEDEARPRQARLSARWYSSFLKKNGIHVQSELDNGGSHAQQ